MGLTMKERHAVTKAVAERYRKAKKKDKGRILDEFVATTGYSRDYAAHKLRACGKAVWLKPGVKLEASARAAAPKQPRKRLYDGKVLAALLKLWRTLDYICAKRLVAALPHTIDALERNGELKLTKSVRGKLMNISAATADRLLKAERKRLDLKGRSHTKPGTLLKHQIPIRTFADWDDVRPGFGEIDLVGHDGGSAHGEHAFTLNMVDVATAWSECEAIRNKAMRWTLAAMQDIRGRLPFDLLGMDSDNGGEFINSHFVRYCESEEITFTRSRANKKNDNCFVEQKNWSVVRRAVGYTRYEGPQAVALLNELYGHLRLYANFFMPVMRLQDKRREGARVIKKYDRARTPYQRVLESEHVPEENKARLKAQYLTLNPAQLKRDMERLQEKLQTLAQRCTRRPSEKSTSAFDYNLNEATKNIST